MESKLITNLKEEESFVQHDDDDDDDDEKVLLVVVKKNVDDMRACNWEDLPSDILGTIFSLLLKFDHLWFRLTCKAWQQSSVNCPSISDSSSIQNFPWLMSPYYPSSKSKNTQIGGGGVFTFYSLISNQSYVKKIPKLAGAYIRCCRFGWLLMSRGCHSLFFYNPFISDSTIQIPDFNFVEFVSMSFTAPPTSPDCIVFGHEMSLGITVAIYRWGYGEDKWTEYRIDCQAPFITSLCTPFFYQDAFYHLDINGRLGVLDPKRGGDKNHHQKLTWKDLTQPTPLNDIIVTHHIKNYVAECDGQWVLVFVGNKGYPIHVFELDWSQMEWVTLQSLGNKAMFIGETGSLLVKTNGSRLENKIYFPRFLNKKGYGKSTEAGTGVFYCLETCKYHAFESEFSHGNWIGTRGVSQFVWIEPNFERDDWFRFLENCVHRDHNDDDNAF